LPQVDHPTEPRPSSDPVPGASPLPQPMVDIPVEDLTDVEKLTDLMEVDNLADLMTGLVAVTTPTRPRPTQEEGPVEVTRAAAGIIPWPAQQATGARPTDY
jgi:hypothetical protein